MFPSPAHVIDNIPLDTHICFLKSSKTYQAFCCNELF